MPASQDDPSARENANPPEFRPPPLLLSEFAADPDMAEVVEWFVNDLPERIVAFQNCLETNDLAMLRGLAHQLKGAAGAYGFPIITEHAKVLEELAQRDHDLTALVVAVQDLVALCRSVRPAQTNTK